MTRRSNAEPTPAPKPAPSDVARSGRSGGASLHQAAAAALRAIILSGELAPGEWLREVAISQRLGMSRTPVREAFRTLAGENLIDLLPNHKVVVSDVRVDDAPDVFAVLGILEALAAQIACHLMSGEQIETLESLQEDLEASFRVSDRAAYTEANGLFHELIVEGSGNQALVAAWRLVVPKAQRARMLRELDRARWNQAVAEHRLMTRALSARDGPLLASLMLLHFENDLASILAKPQAGAGGGRKATGEGTGALARQRRGRPGKYGAGPRGR